MKFARPEYPITANVASEKLLIALARVEELEAQVDRLNEAIDDARAAYWQDDSIIPILDAAQEGGSVTQEELVTPPRRWTVEA